MLGIDIDGQVIRIVQVRRRGNTFQLCRAVTVAIDPDQMDDAAAIGHVLSAALDEHRWSGRHAVMTLPGRGAFIRRLPVDMVRAIRWKGNGQPAKSTIDALIDIARRSMVIPSEQLVYDLWFGSKTTLGHGSGDPPNPHHTVLLGAADKTQVDFCRSVISASGAKVQQLTLRPLAKINGLLFHWGEAHEDHVALIYLNTGHADLALMDGQGFITLQSLPFDDSGGSASDNELIERYERVIQVAQLSQSQASPQRLFIAGGSRQAGHLQNLATLFHERFEIPVSPCDPHTGFSVSDKQLQERDLTAYVPAIGAAMDGLEVTPTWFNFLHPHGMRTSKKKHISWKPFAVAGVLAIIFMFGFWLSMVQQRQGQLRHLDAQIHQTEPSRAGMLAAKDNWRLFQPFVSGLQGGSRQQYLRILYEITRLFPNTADAYVTDLTIFGSDRGALSSNVDIVTNGKVRQGDVLTDFINQLNQSDLFQEAKQAGSLTEEAGDTLYPFLFSMTCNLERPVEGVRP